MNKIDYINLTPHDITIVDMSGKEHVFHPEGLARIDVVKTNVEDIENFSVQYEEELQVSGLPDPFPNRIYITSSRVMLAVRRKDVVSPGEFIRDTDGKIVKSYGFTTFNRNL